VSEFRRKLIETAMPLDVVSRNASREKSIRHGHPSTLHLWWSRKPLAAARAVLFAQIVDDPSSEPDRFPTQALQDAERARLLTLVGELSAWDATANPLLMEQARREVARAVGPAPVTVWDPFAGGGSIPIEGQRLGVPVVSSDLNPVASLLQRASLEIPRRWADRPAVGRESGRLLSGGRAEGLAADVRFYGKRILAAAAERLRPWYPTIEWSGTDYEVAAYLWVRTTICENPACRATVPMLSNPWLRRKKGQEAWLAARSEHGELTFAVHESGSPVERTARGAVFACKACGTATSPQRVQAQGAAGGLGRALRCVVPDAGARRPFLVVDEKDVCPSLVWDGGDLDLDVALDPAVSNAPTYGVATVGQLHLPRQRAALAVFAEGVRGIADDVRSAARVAGWSDRDVSDYGRDVAILMGLVLGRLSNRMSTACIWNAHLGLVEQTFIQNNAIAFPWDFAEANPLSAASGSWASQVDWVARVVERCDPAADAVVVQQDARTPPQALAGRDVIVSTDPPYFDYFLYSSLSDYFYVWLRQGLREVVPELFATVSTPRAGEIVQRRTGVGPESFLDGLTAALTTIGEAASADYPMTIYYAYKSTGGSGGSAWQAFLGAVKAANLMITATWPIRTERTEGIKTGTNSLASSIVVVCRRRDRAPSRRDRRAFLAELRAEIGPAVARLQAASVSPVDLAQAAIGPALAVYTRHDVIVDTDGTEMPVGVALDLVNQILGEALSQQAEDLDQVSRFCLAWFEQYGFSKGPFGAADGLATMKNTSVVLLERCGVLRAAGGQVDLLPPADYSVELRVHPDRRVTVWEVVMHLAKRANDVGAGEAAALMASVGERVELPACRELAYLLYTICERRGWAQSAALFNELGTSWNDLAAAARPRVDERRVAGQAALDFGAEERG
jgi:putative DNA methylase